MAGTFSFLRIIYYLFCITYFVLLILYYLYFPWFLLANPNILLIFAMPNHCNVIAPSSTRIDAQYEIGLFLCPSVNHIVGIHELVPFTKFVDVAICDKCIRLSFPHSFAQRADL